MQHGSTRAGTTTALSLRQDVFHGLMPRPAPELGIAAGGRRGGVEAGPQAAAHLAARRPVGGALPHRHRKRGLRDRVLKVQGPSEQQPMGVAVTSLCQ